MVLLDSHHSEIHVMVGARVERHVRTELHFRPFKGDAHSVIQYVRMLEET